MLAKRNDSQAANRTERFTLLDTSGIYPFETGPSNHRGQKLTITMTKTQSSGEGVDTDGK
jgi:hypothetical protein